VALNRIFRPFPSTQNEPIDQVRLKLSAFPIDFPINGIFRTFPSTQTEPVAPWGVTERAAHLDPVAHVVQHAVVDGLADVAHRPLGVGGRDDLVRAGRVLVGGEDADLPPRHLLLVDVHRLEDERKRRQSAGGLRGQVCRPCGRVQDLRDVVDGGLHAAELRGLDVEHLQHVVGQRVDQVGHAGQRLGGVVLRFLQRSLLVRRLKEKTFYIEMYFYSAQKDVQSEKRLENLVFKPARAPPDVTVRRLCRSFRIKKHPCGRGSNH